MKTTEFLKESAEKYEYDDEVGMVKNNLHTIIRVLTHLNKETANHEDFPEWVQEKIAMIKQSSVEVMNYMISQHEMGHTPEVPGFDIDQAERAFAENIYHEDELDEGLGDSIKLAWAKILMWVADKAVSISKNPNLKNKAKELLAQQTVKIEQLMLAKIAGHPREEQLKQQVHYIVTQLNQETTASDYLRTAHKLIMQLQSEREKFSEQRRTVKEEASAGSTGSPSVAVSMHVLGEKGTFSRRDVNKKLGSYGNQLTRGGPIKLGKNNG